jgi:hypothetical protein
MSSSYIHAHEKGLSLSYNQFPTDACMHINLHEKGNNSIKNIPILVKTVRFF